MLRSLLEDAEAVVRGIRTLMCRELRDQPIDAPTSGETPRALVGALLGGPLDTELPRPAARAVRVRQEDALHGAPRPRPFFAPTEEMSTESSEAQVAEDSVERLGPPRVSYRAPDEECATLVSDSDPNSSLSEEQMSPTRVSARQAYEEASLPAAVRDILEGAQALRRQADRQRSAATRASLAVEVVAQMTAVDSTGQMVRGVKSLAARESGTAKTPKLDSRWRDIFLANEMEGEQDLEMNGGVRDQFYSRNLPSLVMSARPLQYQREGKGMALLLPRVLSPNGAARLAWDCLGALIIIYDLATIPVYLGWSRSYLYTPQIDLRILIASLIFWSVDMPFNLNTGFIQRGGTLEMSRRMIARNYAFTWLGFDIVTVTVDVVLVLQMTGQALEQYHDLRALRMLKALRMLRAVRLLKMSTLGEKFEDFLINLGAQWLVFAASIIRTIACIFIAAHFAACIWYYIGNGSWDRREASWLNLVQKFDETSGCVVQLSTPNGGSSSDSDDVADETVPVSISYQYTRSLYWVLGHLSAAPVDPILFPQSQTERVFTLCLIFASLFIVGSLISDMTNSFAELRRLNAEAVSARRQLVRYLALLQVPRELAARIVRFALYAHKRRSEMHLDDNVLSLLSNRHRAELSVNQRSRYCLMHPLFALLAEGFPEVFRNICEAFEPRIFADCDIVFVGGTVAEGAYITHDGRYRLSGGGGSHKEQLFSEPRCYSEVSLFRKFVHQCTLESLSFGDAIILTCEALLECVRKSPGCVNCLARYAQDYMSHVSDDPSGWDSDCYQATDNMPARLAVDAAKAARVTPVCEKVMLVSPEVEQEVLDDFLAALMGGPGVPLSDLLTQVPEAFGELDPKEGIYAKMQQLEEGNRVRSSIMSVVCLLRNDYSAFVQPQARSRRMNRELWASLQLFVRWADLSPEMVQALLVFLVLRGLSKVKMFAQALPKDARSPEDVVRHLTVQVPQCIPSFNLLGAEMRQLVRAAFLTLSEFNFMQMLQGENTSFHVSSLRDRVAVCEDNKLLRFYLFGVVGVMCGLGGAHASTGSSFMDQLNGTHVLLGLQCLQQVGRFHPDAVYWGYIMSRAREVGLPTRGEEELAIARLACLCRAKAEDVPEVCTAWAELSRGGRAALARNLLADGLRESAVTLLYLPMYFANARGNQAIGLGRALVLLVDLLDAVGSQDYAAQLGDRIVLVDLQDVALYAKEVCNPRMFLELASHITLAVSGAEIQVLVCTKHRQRQRELTFMDGTDTEVISRLRRMEQKLSSVEATVEELLTHPPEGADDDNEEACFSL